MLKGFRSAALAATVLLFAQGAQAGAPEVDAGRDFQGVSLGLDGGSGFEVYAGLREIEGKLAVCGLVILTSKNATTKMLEPRFTEQMTFRVDGKIINVRTHAFKRYEGAEAAKAGKAGCSVTKQPWQKAYAKTPLSMKMGRVTVRY